MDHDGRGWNIDPETHRVLTRAEAAARGIFPPPPKHARAEARRARTTSPPGDTAPPKSNVLPFGPRPTLGDVLRSSFPAPAPPVAPAPAGPTLPPASLSPAAPTTGFAPSPLTGAPPPPAPPDTETDSFAELGGKVAASVAQAIVDWTIRRQGFDPNEPDEDDLEQVERATAKGIRMKFGDAPLPWWGPILAALALLYLSMRNGAKRLAPEPPADAPIVRPPPPPPAPSSAASSPPPPATPPPADRSSRPPLGKPGPIAMWSQQTAA